MASENIVIITFINFAHKSYIYLTKNSLYVIFDDMKRHLWSKRRTKQAQKRCIMILRECDVQTCVSFMIFFFFNRTN